MLRNEIQKLTGLTRKAMEYYEEKGIIFPSKSENGYRIYSKQDVETLIKVSLYRKIGLTLSEIKEILSKGECSLASILRKKQYQIEINQSRKQILELLIKGEDQEVINEKLKMIESHETLYDKLEKAFPGYFGQMIFTAYQPFLMEPLSRDGEQSFREYMENLDQLPAIDFTREEKEYIEQISSSFDMEKLKEVNQSKIQAVENYQDWFDENQDAVSRYEEYKNSQEYQESKMKQIQDKFQKYMEENDYYQVAIPLIRNFSNSYNSYYENLLQANEHYLQEKEK